MKNHPKRTTSGFTLVEVMVVLILLTLSFMVFLQALNTGKSVRVKSEISKRIPKEYKTMINATVEIMFFRKVIG